MVRMISHYFLLSSLFLSLGSAVFAEDLTSNPTAIEEVPAASAIDTVQIFNLWSVQCLEEAACIASTSLVRDDEDGNTQRVVELRIASSGNNRSIAILARPGVLIRPGVEVKVGQQAARLEYLLCTSRSCVARALLSDELFNAIKSGDFMSVTFVLAPGQRNPARNMTIDIALDGSSAALEAIEDYK